MSSLVPWRERIFFPTSSQHIRKPFAPSNLAFFDDRTNLSFMIDPATGSIDNHSILVGAIGVFSSDIASASTCVFFGGSSKHNVSPLLPASLPHTRVWADMHSCITLLEQVQEKHKPCFKSIAKLVVLVDSIYIHHGIVEWLPMWKATNNPGGIDRWHLAGFQKINQLVEVFKNRLSINVTFCLQQTKPGPLPLPYVVDEEEYYHLSRAFKRAHTIPIIDDIDTSRKYNEQIYAHGSGGPHPQVVGQITGAIGPMLGERDRISRKNGGEYGEPGSGADYEGNVPQEESRGPAEPQYGVEQYNVRQYNVEQYNFEQYDVYYNQQAAAAPPAQDEDEEDDEDESSGLSDDENDEDERPGSSDEDEETTNTDALPDADYYSYEPAPKRKRADEQPDEQPQDECYYNEDGVAAQAEPGARGRRVEVHFANADDAAADGEWVANYYVGEGSFIGGSGVIGAPVVNYGESSQQFGAQGPVFDYGPTSEQREQIYASQSRTPEQYSRYVRREYEYEVSVQASRLGGQQQYVSEEQSPEDFEEQSQQKAPDFLQSQPPQSPSPPPPPPPPLVALSDHRPYSTLLRFVGGRSTWEGLHEELLPPAHYSHCQPDFEPPAPPGHSNCDS